jgi:hypothetical protein
MAETIDMVLDRLEAQQANTLQLRPEANSLDLLRAVYRNPSIPLPVRIRCAVAALPHEVPRLSVVAQVNEQDFATLLDRRLKKMEAMNQQPAEPQTQTIEVKPPMPRLGDRRYRRV